jgi:hypothetical protein
MKNHDKIGLLVESATSEKVDAATEQDECTAENTGISKV